MSTLRSSAILLQALLAISIFAGVPLRGDTISVTLESAGPANDGSYYVLPYVIRLDSNQDIYADCYDFFDEVSVGQSWQANELTISQVATAGQFASDTNALVRYKDVAWLSAQTTSSTQQQVDLQHDIWNVFDPGTFTETSGMDAYLASLEAADLTTYDFSRFTFLEGVGNTTGGTPVQAFVVMNGLPSTPSNSLPISPEPGTWVLMLGAALLGGIHRFRVCRREAAAR